MPRGLVGGVLLVAGAVGASLWALDSPAWAWAGAAALVLGAGLTAVAVGAGERESVPELVPLHVPLEEAGRARISIRYGGGPLFVGPSLDPDALIDGTFAEGVQVRVDRRGSFADVTLRRARGRWRFLSSRKSPNQWSLGINPRVPVVLDLRTTSNDSSLDLSGLLVTEVDFHTGSSHADLTVPAHGRSAVHVRSGAADVRLHVPQGVEARLTFRAGLLSSSIDSSRFPGSGGLYESVAFASSTDRVEIDLEGSATTLWVD